MKVSVLVPSRNRPEMLKDSIDSLGKGDFEILLAVDEDDPQLQEYKKINRIDKMVRLFVMAPHGYQNLQEYFNFMSAKARGDWLMLWNDDAVMETPNWLEVIGKQDHSIPQVLNVWNERDNLFPLISRPWYEAVGHFSLNTHADSWVQQVADIDGRSIYVPGISIKHYGEELNDETHTKVRDVVRQTSEAYRRMHELRLVDARKISEWRSKSVNKVKDQENKHDKKHK